MTFVILHTGDTDSYLGWTPAEYAIQPGCQSAIIAFTERMMVQAYQNAAPANS